MGAEEKPHPPKPKLLTKTKIAKDSVPRKQILPWYKVLDLITAAPTPIIERFLNRILRHTNTTPGHPRIGWAWPSQGLLAKELKVTRRTVERTVEDAKALGVIEVRIVRTGKGKKDQYNEYRLNLIRLKELYELPSPVSVAQESSYRQTEGELPTNDVRATDTQTGEGLYLKQVDIKAGKESSSAVSSVGDDDDASTQNRIEKKIQDARLILTSRGHPLTLIDTALAMIDERSSLSGTIPSSAKYFVDSFANLLGNPKDAAILNKWVSRRERFGCHSEQLTKRAQELADCKALPPQFRDGCEQ